MDRGADITLKDMELRSALHVAIGNTSTMDALMKVPTSQHYKFNLFFINQYSLTLLDKLRMN